MRIRGADIKRTCRASSMYVQDNLTGYQNSFGPIFISEPEPLYSNIDNIFISDFDGLLGDNDYNGYSVSDTYFFSYCLDALALSLHSLYTTNNAMDAIYKSINFLGDADSNGAITGQLAVRAYHSIISARQESSSP